MKRLKKALKWTAVVLGALVAIGLVANAWFVWTTSTRLEAQLAAIRAAGDPLTIADLARPPIPPEKNAATYFRQAETYVKAIDGEVWANDWYKQWKSGGPMPDEGKKLVKAAIDAHPQVFPPLEQAALCLGYDAGLDHTVEPRQFLEQLLPIMQEIRAAARVLHLRAYLLAAEGDYDEAVRTGLTLFRIGHLFENNQSITSYMVAITMQNLAVECVNFAMQSGPVSAEVRNALNAELALHEHSNGLRWGLKSERAFGCDQFRAFPARNFWLAARVHWNREESAYLDAIQAYITMASKPGFQQEDKKSVEKALSAQGVSTDPPHATKWGSVKQALAQRGIFASLITPALQAAHEAATRGRAMIRCLRVLNALQTHVPEGSDHVPILTELGLPAETTTDPYTGEPLHVKKLPQGWLIYAVGRNYKDDGGKLDDTSDIGIGPPPTAEAVESRRDGRQ
jgi:hypothetical protein